jgi:membrane associated rhomboid family serine protease
MEKEEIKRLFSSLVVPAILVILLWLIKLAELGTGISFSMYGLEPQVFKGLRGILFSPLLHSDWKHLTSNSLPLLVLTWGLYYYYRNRAHLILISCWLVTGFWVWVFAADTGIHIGASGVVYSLATFHITSALLRREPRLMAFALLVIFLYGGMIWGIFPEFFPERNISWESHLLGGIAGIVLAFGFRFYGPQRKVYEWEDDDESPDGFSEIEPGEKSNEKPESNATIEKPDKNPNQPYIQNNTGSASDSINYKYRD